MGDVGRATKESHFKTLLYLTASAKKHSVGWCILFQADPIILTCVLGVAGPGQVRKRSEYLVAKEELEQNVAFLGA